MTLNTFIEILISLPKTLYFNFRYIPFRQALKIPCFIGYKTKMLDCKRGSIEFGRTVEPFVVKFGIKGSMGIVSNSYSAISVRGRVIFKGKASFASGSSLRVDGKAVFGNNFSTNKNCFISCAESISIGDNVLLGWNVAIRDSDGHPVYYNGIQQKDRAEINIGNHVWIASEVHILKGVIIGDNSIIGYRSTVTKPFPESNVLVAGYPAKVIKENVNWDLEFK